MGCCGGEREKYGALSAEQKWDYINLDDFKSTSCWTPFAYGYLLLMFVVSISIYAVDTFTAINLLAFDRWAGQIKPVIPFNISRWIFAGCIILSFVFLVYRWLRAVRVMRQGGVAKSYLDPLAVRVQSIRWGKARGWKRFLVFAELTKSRKGADYVALFTYFSFEAWMRIVFAEGPRQVVNALTLYSVMKLNLIPEGQHAAADGHSPVAQFFVNVGVLADSNHLQAVILFGMLWTLFIWVIEVVSLIISVTLYLLFLWHHIPSEDGGLTGYCRNKINRRMERIVQVKVDKALKRENQLRAREEAKAAREGCEIKKQPTLPNIAAAADLDSLPPLSRQTTLTSLPEYSSRPGTSGRHSDEPVPRLPDLASRPGMPLRKETQASETSWSSYSSNAPLISAAGDMGYAPDRPHTPRTTPADPWYTKPLPNRSVTGLSQFSQRPYSPGPARPGTAQGHRAGDGPGAYQMDPLPRPGTGMSGMSGLSNAARPPPPSDMSNTFPWSEDRSSTSSTKPPSWTGSHGDRAMDNMGHRTPAAAMAPSVHGLSEDRGRNSPLPGPQFRAQTPSAGIAPSVRGLSEDRGRNSPLPGPQFRSQTPSRGPLERSYTPTGLAPARAMTPTGQPTLPRLQTPSPKGYVAYAPEPRSMTPSSSTPLSNSSIRSTTEPARTYSPLSRPRPAGGPSPYPRGPPSPQRMTSGLDDILDHY